MNLKKNQFFKTGFTKTKQNFHDHRLHAAPCIHSITAYSWFCMTASTRITVIKSATCFPLEFQFNRADKPTGSAQLVLVQTSSSCRLPIITLNYIEREYAFRRCSFAEMRYRRWTRQRHLCRMAQERCALLQRMNLM